MRAAVLDRRAQPVKNLATGPGFERASPIVAVERWRNLCTNPVPSSGTNLPANVNGATGGYEGAIQGIRVVVAEGGTGDAGLYLTPALGDVTQGWYSYSVEVEAVKAGLVRVSVQGAFGTYNQAAVSFAAGEKKILSCSVLHTGTGTAAVYVLRNTTAASEFIVRKIQKTRTPHVLPYFDGGMENDSLSSPFGLDYTYTWSGAAGASATICTGPLPWQTIWTNMLPNPSADVNGDGFGYWQGGGGAAGATRVASGGMDNGSFYRCTWSAPTTMIDGGVYYGASPIPVVAGQTYAWSAYVRSSKAQQVRTTAQWKKADGSPSTVSPATNGQIWTLPANTWTRISVIGVCPSDAVGSQMTAYASSAMWAAGDTLDMDWVMLTNSVAVLDYFDGTSVTGKWNDPDFTAAWTGATGTTTSVIRGVAPLNVAGANSACIQSFTGVTRGRKSLRIIPLHPSRDSYADLIGMMGGFDGMKDDRTYTALIRSYQSGPITNPTGGNVPRSMWAVTTGAQVGGNLAQSTAGPNAAGFTDHRMTYKVNVGATYKSLRVINGGDINGGDIWYDNFMVVEGKYSGPQIDGDSENAKWLGTPHTSESVGYPKAA
jgi:hypothetical protein